MYKSLCPEVFGKIFPLQTQTAPEKKLFFVFDFLFLWYQFNFK